jgi:hypothetical protein
MEGVENVEHWFEGVAWRKLVSLYGQILELPADDREKEFFLVVFSSILRAVSRADDQSQKTYVSGTRTKTAPEVFVTFQRQLGRAVARMTQLVATVGPAAPPEVPDDGNALTMAVRPNSIDLMVTSPPYLDSVDYMYNFMLEYFWLGPFLGVPSRRAFNAMRRSPVGAKRPAVTELTMPRELAGIIELSEVSPNRRFATAAYFRALRLHLRLAAQALRSGSRYVMVVGNSQTAGKPIPVHNAVVALAREHGLQLERAFAYRIRRHYMKFPRMARGGIILMDWVLVLKQDESSSPRAEDLPTHWLSADPEAVAN